MKLFFIPPSLHSVLWAESRLGLYLQTPTYDRGQIADEAKTQLSLFLQDCLSLNLFAYYDALCVCVFLSSMMVLNLKVSIISESHLKT